MIKIGFLVLSFLSGIIELGSVFLGISLNIPIPMIILFPLFYQLGNLMMNYNIFRRKTIYIIMAIIVIGLGIFNWAGYSYISLAIQFIFSSFCIQATRDKYKKDCPSKLKRSFRIAGFAVSPIMIHVRNEQLIMIISMILCLIFWLNSSDISDLDQSQKVKSNQRSYVMIFHQAHYFVYTYIMPIYIFQITRSYIWTAIAFAITWIVYLIPEEVEKKYKIDHKKMFFACHIFLAISIGGISLASTKGNYILVSLFWLLTGLGGGSVFCIKHLTEKYENINMDLSENIGHGFGALIAILICYMFPNKEIIYLTSISCIFVIITLVIAVCAIRKEN